MIPRIYQSTPVVCACGHKAPRLLMATAEGLEQAAARGLAAQGWQGAQCPACCGGAPDTRPVGERLAEVIARIHGTP